MFVVKSRFRLWVVGFMYSHKTIRATSEDCPNIHKSGSPSGRVNIEGNPTHLPSREKHRRVTPLKWHGTDIIASGDGSAIMSLLIIDEKLV